MELEISRINICEVCRENILDFYELLKQKEFQVEVKIPEEAVFILDYSRLCRVKWLKAT